MTRGLETVTANLAAADPKSIDVCHLDLDDAGGWLDALDARLGLLAADEHVDAANERLAVEVRRRRRRARVLLRWALLERHGVAAARGGIVERDEHGKPFMVGAPAFNVSHSGPLCVIAVAGTGPVGVDVEMPREVQLGPDRQALIVAAGLGLCPGEGDALPFLTAWTRLEALAKARGDGVGRLLTALGITAAGVGTITPAEVTERARAIAAADGVAVTGLDLPGGAFGAVAGPVALVAQGVVCRAMTSASLQ